MNRPISLGACSMLAAQIACAPADAVAPPSRSALESGAPERADRSPVGAEPVAAYDSQPSPASSSRARPQLATLEVPGHLPAVVVVPAGDDTRPVVVAAHGAGGAPEWECDYWSRLTQGTAFVLCLRGTRMGEGSFYFKEHYSLGAELDAAVAALRASYPRVASGSGVYAGFSQGASMGSLIVADRGAQFPYVVLIEGFVQWNAALGRKFAKRGGKAVLWACGTRDCASKAEASARALDQAQVRARAQSLPGAGHTPTGPVMAAVADNLGWLFGPDPAWCPLTGCNP